MSPFCFYGASHRIRTCGLLLRRQLLYPTELETQIGAGDGNRTHATSLEGWNSTIELHPHGCAPKQRKLLYHQRGVLSRVNLEIKLFSF